MNEIVTTDIELLEAYLDGDEQAFKILINRYTPLLYNFVARLAGRESAPDIVQEIFIKVWKNIRKFDIEKASFKTWVFTIAKNTATDFLRKKKDLHFSDLDIDDELSFAENIPDEAILPDTALERLEDKLFLNNLLDQLPYNYKTVLVLHYQEEMTFEEISVVLGKPTNTIKSHHRRALIHLRKMFN